MQKARSRLEAAPTAQSIPPVVTAPKTQVRVTSNPFSSSPPSQTPSAAVQKNKKSIKTAPTISGRAAGKYVKHAPIFMFSIGLYATLWYLVTHFYPAQLANVIITGAYLPVMVLFFFATFFLFSFALLSTKKSLVVTLVITAILFLRLQHVVF